MLSNFQPRVLCIEDDEDSCEMMVLLLKHAFIDAKTVATGAQALSLMETERFDLYMLDAWLPGLNGFELCRRIRAIEPERPILFFSGAAGEQNIRKGLEAGADAYVTKPNIDDLVSTVTRFVFTLNRETATSTTFTCSTSDSVPSNVLAAA